MMNGEPMNDAPPKRPDLSVVVPSFNEADLIEDVVTVWVRELERLEIAYEFLIYDAGSTDGTLDILARLRESHPGLETRVCPKLPHGPSVIKGFREAHGRWVFQMDSDKEMGPEHFETLWRRREDYDFLLGCREGRESPLARRIVTAVSKGAVRVLFGPGIWDVNSPYRLIRAEALADLMKGIPDDTIAPNVILCGLAVRRKLRIFQCWVPHRGRKVGTASLVKLRLWKIAASAFLQTVRAAVKG
jgi:glycosyltransferase involved in cell wall biosynthesis